MKTIEELKELAIDWDKESTEYDCNITLKVGKDTFKAYSCSVGYKELMFNCDKGTLSYCLGTVNGGVTWFLELYGVEYDA